MTECTQGLILISVLVGMFLVGVGMLAYGLLHECDPPHYMKQARDSKGRFCK